MWLQWGSAEPPVTEQRLVTGDLRTGHVLQLVQLHLFEQLEASILCLK